MPDTTTPAPAAPPSLSLADFHAADRARAERKVAELRAQRFSSEEAGDDCREADGCSACGGTGEGQFDGQSCMACRGRGH